MAFLVHMKYKDRAGSAQIFFRSFQLHLIAYHIALATSPNRRPIDHIRNFVGSES